MFILHEENSSAGERLFSPYGENDEIYLSKMGLVSAAANDDVRREKKKADIHRGDRIRWVCTAVSDIDSCLAIT